MSTTLPPFYSRNDSSPPEAESDVHASALAAAAVFAPSLIALFRQSDQRLVYLNTCGRQWIAPDGDHDLEAVTLHDIFATEGVERLETVILLRAELLGHWRGHCTLRSNWGSEIPVFATVSIHPPTPGQPEALITIQAVQDTSSGNPDYLHTSDQELLHALLDSATDAIYYKDRHSRFIRVSRSLAEKDGVEDPNVLIGKTDFERFTAEHAQPAYDDEQRIIATGQPIIEHEEKETWPDGRETWVSTSKFPLLDLNGEVIGTFGISRDITARKVSEQKARALELQLALAQKLESIGRLAAGVAHEINTPTQFISDNTRFLTTSFAQLNTVIQSYRNLQAAAQSDGALTDLASAAAHAATDNDLDFLLSEIPLTLEQTLEGLGRIARIVRSLKEFSHPNSPQPVAVDLNRVIETTVTVSRHEWKYVADVACELDPDLPLVPCVVDEISQAMLNLIVNAAHAIESAQPFRPPGERGRITVRTRSEDDFAVVEIADTGTGIPLEAQPHIFDPFFTTKEVGKGTGQGLAIVQTVICQHHHGSIDFTTKPGIGTTFCLRLPHGSVPPSP